MPRLLLTRPVRVAALVVQIFLDLALLFGRLSGVLGLGIGVAAGLLVHLCRMSGIAEFETPRVRPLRDLRALFPRRGSAPAAYRHRKACRPTILCHVVSTSWPAPALSAQCRLG